MQRNQLAAIPSDEERLVLATRRYVGEGFDDARLDVSRTRPSQWPYLISILWDRTCPPSRQRIEM